MSEGQRIAAAMTEPSSETTAPSDCCENGNDDCIEAINSMIDKVKKQNESLKRDITAMRDASRTLEALAHGFQESRAYRTDEGTRRGFQGADH